MQRRKNKIVGIVVHHPYIVALACVILYNWNNKNYHSYCLLCSTHSLICFIICLSVYNLQKHSIIIINSVIVCILDISDLLMKAPTELELCKELADIRTRWRVIGLGLRLPTYVLEIIQKDGITDENKLLMVINRWKESQSSPFTWETVIATIEGPPVNNRKKANEIRNYLSKGNNYLILNPQVIV